MKKFLLTAMLLMIALFVVACNDDNADDTSAASGNEIEGTTNATSDDVSGDTNNDTPDDTTPETISGFARGTWSGNVFTSEQLGITFTMPDGWFSATDEEMAAVMGLGMDIIGEEITPQMLEAAGLITIHDMMASNPETGALVQIMADRLVFPHTRISVEDYIESMAEGLELMGMDADTNFPNATLGSNTWGVFTSSFEFMPDINIYGHYFVDIRDGFAITIQIAYSEFSESLEEILEMFR